MAEREGMTAPRQIVAGRTLFLSRRCTQRQHLLRPDKEVGQIFLYCLAEAAARFEITLHAWIAMSNHEHVVFRDNLGNAPEFVAHLNKMVAKTMNARLERSENFWSNDQPNLVYLVGAQDRLDKIVYTLTNPVTDHLVERVSDWPGACSLRLNLSGGEIKVKRPRGYFRTDGPMPEQVSLRAELPAGFEHLTHVEWQRLLETELRIAEAAARTKRAETGLRVLGRKSVLKTHPTDKPTTEEPRRTLRPHVACKDPARRMRELVALRGFRAAYRRARERWCARDRRVVFPSGTYRMKSFGARCAPDSECMPPA